MSVARQYAVRLRKQMLIGWAMCVIDVVNLFLLLYFFASAIVGTLEQVRLALTKRAVTRHVALPYHVLIRRVCAGDYLLL